MMAGHALGDHFWSPRRRSSGILGSRLLVAVLALIVTLACQSPSTQSPSARAPSAPAPGAPGSPGGAASAQAAPAQAAAPLQVVVAHAGVTPNVSPVWVAVDLGFDREHGLNIVIQQTRTAVLSQAALLAGEIDYAWTGIGTAMAARASGSDVIVIAATQTRAAGELIVQPEITTPEALKGKRLGVQSLGGGPPHLRTLKALERMGLDPVRDNISIMQTGDEPTAALAVLDRAIDGASLSYSAAKELRDRGFPGWDLATLNVTELLGITTREATSRDRGEETRRLLRALGASIHYIKQIGTDSTARERVGGAVAARLGSSPDTVLLQLDAIHPHMPADLRIQMADAREQQADMVAVQPAVSSVRMDEMVDQTRLDEIDREGFFRTLR